MNASIIIRRSFNIRLLIAAVALLSANATQAALTPNLLVDPGFENPVLTPFTQILGAPYLTGVWGAENGGNVTGPVFSVSPNAGARMHRQNNAGATASQSWQLVNVSAYSAAINTGTTTVNASALFNAAANLPAALGSVAVSFFDASQTQLPPVFVAAPANPDALPGTWQNYGVTNVPVPVNTAFIRMQLAYSNASIGTLAGFQDDAVLQLNIVPEPASAALAACGLAGLAFAVRKRRTATKAARSTME